jgi:hypothetical protein
LKAYSAYNRWQQGDGRGLNKRREKNFEKREKIVP